MFDIHRSKAVGKTEYVLLELEYIVSSIDCRGRSKVTRDAVAALERGSLSDRGTTFLRVRMSVRSNSKVSERFTYKRWAFGLTVVHYRGVWYQQSLSTKSACAKPSPRYHGKEWYAEVRLSVKTPSDASWQRLRTITFRIQGVQSSPS